MNFEILLMMLCFRVCLIYLFIYLGFYIAFTVQVISRWVVGRAEGTSTYSLLGFCTVNCQPTASNYQLSHLRPCQEVNPGFRGGRQECYHSATVAPRVCLNAEIKCYNNPDYIKIKKEAFLAQNWPEVSENHLLNKKL